MCGEDEEEDGWVKAADRQDPGEICCENYLQIKKISL